jgi:hypothetical protein
LNFAGVKVNLSHIIAFTLTLEIFKPEYPNLWD